MVKAKIEKDANGVHRIMTQRAKYKHWFELGKHRDTTASFYRALALEEVSWDEEVKSTDTLFE